MCVCVCVCVCVCLLALYQACEDGVSRPLQCDPLTFDILQVLLSQCSIHSTPKKLSKITYFLKPFHMQKLINEERQGNVTLTVAAQDVEFDFRFGSQHVLSQTGVPCTISLKYFEYQVLN